MRCTVTEIRLSDDELHLLIAHSPPGPRRDILVNALKSELRWKLIRRLPARTGVCGHGSKVYVDEKGGYVCHDKRGGVCNGGAGLDVVWDEPTPEVRRLRALIDSLK